LPRPSTPEEISAFRDRVCDAAALLFAEHGVAGVTMRAIAARLGVSPMATYRYFKDKDAILSEVLRRAFERFVAVLDAAGDVEGDAFERARSKCVAYREFALAEPGTYRVMFEMPHPSEATHPEMGEAMEKARATMRRTMAELIAAGLVVGNADVLGHVFWSAIHGPISLYLAGKLAPDQTPKEVIATTIRGLFFSLAPQR